MEYEEDEKMEENEEEFLYLINNNDFKNDLFLNTVSVSNKEKNYTKREEHLKQNGYEKTYQGRYGATWEKIQKKEQVKI